VVSDSEFSRIDHADGFEQLYSGGYNPPIYRDRGALCVPVPNRAARIGTAIKRLTFYDEVEVLTLETELSILPLYGDNKLRGIDVGLDTHFGSPTWTPRGLRRYYALRHLFAEVDGSVTNRLELKTGNDSVATFTASTTNASPTLSVVSSFAGLEVGHRLAGTGIAADAYILSMNTGASTLVMSANATAANAGVTIMPQSTFTPLPGYGWPAVQLSALTAVPTRNTGVADHIEWPPNEGKRNRVFMALQVEVATGHYLGARFCQSVQGAFDFDTANPILGSDSSPIKGQVGVLDRFANGCNIAFDNRGLISGSQTMNFLYLHRARLSAR
jgi:hypothetical protein